MNIAHGGNLFEITRRRGWDWRDVIEASASINPLGPAPGVRPAIEGALERIVHYPEREAGRLKEALAALWDVDPEQIVLGNGATDLIHFLARVRPREAVTLAVPTFTEFHRAYPEASLTGWEDADQWPDSGMLILTQPNSPTGRLMPFERLRDWLLSTSHPVLIDESFLDFCDAPSAMSLLAERRNLLVLRSLTKFYALPGLRLGALVGDRAMIGALAARREPWQVNVLAEEAALAAIADRAHAARTKCFVLGERNWLWDQLSRICELSPVPGDANFFLIHVPGRAAEWCRWLLEQKVIVRDCTGWPGVEGEAIRIAVRTRAENQRIVALLRECDCGR